MGNEKGFIYPLTFITLILFSTFIFIHINLYASETKFFKETEDSLEKEYYFKLAVKEVQVILNDDASKGSSGTIPFRNGTINYLIEQMPNETLRITVLLTRDGKEKVTGFAYYDQALGKFIKWQEKS